MPFQNTIHTDQLLSNVSVKYQPQGFVWDQVFPQVMVNKDSNRYRIYTANFRIPETKRANKSASRQHYFEVSYGSYLLEKHSLKDYATDDDARNYDIFSLEVDITEELTKVINQRLELMTTTLMTKTSWSLNTSLAATGVWSLDTVASNPIPTIDTATSTVLLNSGFKPNYAVLPFTSLQAVKRHQSILDRFKYTSSEVTANMLAKLFEVDTLLVPSSIYDTGTLGATSVVAEIWPDDMFIGYKPSTASPLKPSAGYMFMLDQPRVKKWRDEQIEATAIEVTVLAQPKVVASLSGYLIINTL